MEDERDAPRVGAQTRVAVSGAERRPEPSWRQNTVPGQATEIPSARLSTPQEAAAVITPSMVITGPVPRTAAPANTSTNAAKKGPEKAPAATPAAPSQPTYANLPVMPAGAPNPFDPKSAEPGALPVLTSTTPTVRPELVADAEKSRETSSGNVLSRFFNGITGVFGGGGS
jgi:hypothetical protein